MNDMSICTNLVAYAKKAVKDRLVLEKSGNFSIIDRAKQILYITPSGIHRENLEPTQIVVVDLENNQLAGLGKASSEVLMHIEIYKARPDVGAIVHVHSVFATAYAVANIPLEPWVVESLIYGGKIHVAPFTMPGTLELANGVVHSLGNNKAVLLQNHGVTCVGANIEDAYLNALYIEDTAQICFIASQLGTPKAIPDNVIAELTVSV